MYRRSFRRCRSEAIRDRSTCPDLAAYSFPFWPKPAAATDAQFSSRSFPVRHSIGAGPRRPLLDVELSLLADAVDDIAAARAQRLAHLLERRPHLGLRRDRSSPRRTTHRRHSRRPIPRRCARLRLVAVAAFEAVAASRRGGRRQSEFQSLRMDVIAERLHVGEALVGMQHALGIARALPAVAELDIDIADEDCSPDSTRPSTAWRIAASSVRDPSFCRLDQPMSGVGARPFASRSRNAGKGSLAGGSDGAADAVCASGRADAGERARRRRRSWSGCARGRRMLLRAQRPSEPWCEGRRWRQRRLRGSCGGHGAFVDAARLQHGYAPPFIEARKLHHVVGEHAAEAHALIGRPRNDDRESQNRRRPGSPHRAAGRLRRCACWPCRHRTTSVAWIAGAEPGSVSTAAPVALQACLGVAGRGWFRWHRRGWLRRGWRRRGRSADCGAGGGGGPE